MRPYYEHGGITIYHGDCREILPLAADVLVMDPPYGIAYESGWVNALPGISGDETTALRDHVLAQWPSGPAIVFGTWRRPRPAATSALLVWEKGMHVGMGDLSMPWKPNTEEVYVIGSGFVGHRGSAVLRYPAPVSWNGESDTMHGKRLHPHEKPLGLMLELVSKCPPGSVLDPFCGSGVTLRAAKELSRRAIGIEIEERYCEIAAKRLGQEVLFGAGA